MKLPNLWEEWTIEDRIGAGSYGTVYQAVCGTKRCAVKVIDIPGNDSERDAIKREYPDIGAFTLYCENQIESLMEEINLMETMKDNPNIVRVYDSVVERDTDQLTWHIFIRMELLESLADYQTHEDLNEKRVVQLGLDLCNALRACEAHGVIHRDIKPDNILMSAEGVAKLGDFGAARRVDMSSGTLSLKGSFSYMAPEIYHGEKYDSRVDQYSLGIVLYQYLNNNRLPFVAASKQVIFYRDREEAMIRRMSGEALPAPCDASDHLAEVVCRACDYDPANRFPDIISFQAALYESIGVTLCTGCGCILEAKADHCPYCGENLSVTDPVESTSEADLFREASQPEECSSSRFKISKKRTIISVVIVAIIIVATVSICTHLTAGTPENSVVEENGGETEDTIAVDYGLSNPTIEEDDTMDAGQKVTWNCVYFGSYPQTEIVDQAETSGVYGQMCEEDTSYIADADLYAQLEESDYDENGDTTIDGVKYRRLSSEDASFINTGSPDQVVNLDGSTFTHFYNWVESESTYHYFRYEPVKWRVLSLDGHNAFLLSDLILDAQLYDEGNTGQSVTWETSSIREWLNGSFLSTIFTQQEQLDLQNMDVINEDNPVSGTEGGDDTEDFVIFLSDAESKEERFGFSEYTIVYDEARRAKGSTYARAMGIGNLTISVTAEENLEEKYRYYSTWWLRSPGSFGSDYAAFVDESGVTSDEGGSPVGGLDGNLGGCYGVRPAIMLDLSSDDWTKADDVTDEP